MRKIALFIYYIIFSKLPSSYFPLGVLFNILRVVTLRSVIQVGQKTKIQKNVYIGNGNNIVIGHNCQINENVKLDNVVYLSARALRNLNSLLFIVENNVSRETVCIFPKGRSYKRELVESQKNWKFDFNLIDSNTSEDSKVIVLKGLERVS